VNLLTAGQIEYLPVKTIALFGFYYCIRIWTDTYSMLLQSMSKLKIFWIYVPIQGIISFTAQYLCAIKFGLNGIIIGLITSFLFTAVWVLPLAYTVISRKNYEQE